MYCILINRILLLLSTMKRRHSLSWSRYASQWDGASVPFILRLRESIITLHAIIIKNSRSWNREKWNKITAKHVWALQYKIPCLRPRGVFSKTVKMRSLQNYKRNLIAVVWNIASGIPFACHVYGIRSSQVHGLNLCPVIDSTLVTVTSY